MWRLLTEGVGLLVVLMVMPGGLATAMGAVRDRVVAAVLRRRRLDADGEPLELGRVPRRSGHCGRCPGRELTWHATSPSEIVRGTGVDAERVGVEPAVSCRNIDVSFGRLQVLFGVDLTIACWVRSWRGRHEWRREVDGAPCDLPVWSWPGASAGWVAAASPA